MHFCTGEQVNKRFSFVCSRIIYSTKCSGQLGHFPCAIFKYCLIFDVSWFLNLRPETVQSSKSPLDPYMGANLKIRSLRQISVTQAGVGWHWYSHWSPTLRLWKVELWSDEGSQVNRCEHVCRLHKTFLSRISSHRTSLAMQAKLITSWKRWNGGIVSPTIIVSFKQNENWFLTLNLVFATLFITYTSKVIRVI